MKHGKIKVGDIFVRTSGTCRTIKILAVGVAGGDHHECLTIDAPNNKKIIGQKMRISDFSLEFYYVRYQPDSSVQCEIASESQSTPPRKPCTCTIQTIMNNGCCCGHVVKKQWGLRA